MLYASLLVSSLLILAAIHRVDCLQCYKCTCLANSNGTGCQNDNDLQCLVEYVENNYCLITRSLSNNLTFGHKSNADLVFLESLHYLRAREEIVYSEISSTWQAPAVREFSYGCDWNLCNTPRIVGLLPRGLTFAVNPQVLTNTLISPSGEPLTTCASCTKCVNSTGGLTCSTVQCNGTCMIDDYLDDPILNAGSCLFAFESVCLSEQRSTAVEITGTYYIDDDKLQVNEIDLWCRTNNCNDPPHVQTIQRNVTYLTAIDDQLYFRPDVTTAKPPAGLLGCYTCHCERKIGSEDCKVLECTIEYRNGSYCEIVRDLENFDDMEFITLGHVERAFVPFPHYIHAKEELVLYQNLSWNPPSVKTISYICDWELCNDGRIVDKLATSFKFKAESSEIATYLQSPEPLSSCVECRLCTNASLDINTCNNSTCSPTGRCFITQYIDDPQFNDCEYAFQAECEDGASETSITITATYNLDDDLLRIDEVDLYCSKNGCNRPETVYSLIDLLSEDIQLDALFFIRPVMNTTSLPIIIEPTPATSPPTTTSGTTASAGFVMTVSNVIAVSGFFCSVLLSLFMTN